MPAGKAGIKYFRPKAAPKPSAAGETVVVNSASFLPGICPGSLATIFGQNLTDVSGVVSASRTPLPFELGGVSVYVNGVQAALYTVAYANGEDQINFQVPFETAVGSGAAQVEVTSFGETTATIVVDSFTGDPGIFTYNGYSVAVHADGSLITRSDPARPGETIVMYTTGLGPVTADVPDGYPAPSDPLAKAVACVPLCLKNTDICCTKAGPNGSATAHVSPAANFASRRGVKRLPPQSHVRAPGKIIGPESVPPFHCRSPRRSHCSSNSRFWSTL